MKRTTADGRAEGMHAPPVLPSEQIETRSGYLGTFRHLAGSVFSFAGDERQGMELAERAGRSEFQEVTDLALTPAAWYPLYPTVAARGAVPAGGLTPDTGDAHALRHEPSGDPARLETCSPPTGAS